MRARRSTVDDSDRRLFLDALGEVVERYSLALLRILPDDQSLPPGGRTPAGEPVAPACASVNGLYTQRFNRRHEPCRPRLPGPLQRGAGGARVSPARARPLRGAEPRSRRDRPASRGLPLVQPARDSGPRPGASLAAAGRRSSRRSARAARYLRVRARRRSAPASPVGVRSGGRSSARMPSPSASVQHVEDRTAEREMPRPQALRLAREPGRAASRLRVVADRARRNQRIREASRIAATPSPRSPGTSACTTRRSAGSARRSPDASSRRASVRAAKSGIWSAQMPRFKTSTPPSDDRWLEHLDRAGGGVELDLDADRQR